ncbi:MAG: type II and III secretion system protein family protein [Alphaproteobacteria bacterium]
MRAPKLVLALAALAAWILPPAPAAIAQTAGGTSGVIRIDLAAPGGSSQSLALPQGKSAIIDLPMDVRDVLVTNPGTAQAVLRTPRRIFILGQTPGATDAVFFDSTGRRVLSLNIRVDIDVSSLAQTINRLLPNAQVHVEAINNSLILSGQVANLGDADRALQIAKASVPTAAGGGGSGGGAAESVINMLGIAGKDQVMLKVRVVEMQRNVIKQLGFNLNAVLNQLGEPQYLLGSAATFAVNGALLGGMSGGYKLDTKIQPQVEIPCGAGFVEGALCPIVSRTARVATNQNTAGSPGLNSAESTIKAFERVGMVRTLAEPNLTAVSGEGAKFLAGGEYPVPVAQDKTGSITVEYKPFGVGLGFTPVVLSSGRIALKISTEVSELTTTGAFTLGSSASGTALTIPALTVRRAETSVELPSGGSMMIAGLISQSTKQNLDGLPGVGAIPILGSLFRSRDFLSGETELVIMVSPYIVQSTNPDKFQTPADGLRIADDASTILLDQLNKAYKSKPQPTASRTYQGPYGYVIE